MECACEDASVRRYFRVHVHSDSFIVMDAPPEEIDSSVYVRVTRILADVGVNVPRIHAISPEQGFLLLTDLGSEQFLDVLGEGREDELYADAIEALLAIQAHASTAGLPEYDTAFLRREMELFPQWFLARHLGVALRREQRRVLADAFGLLCESAAEQPRVFVHRDYHSRNLMLHRKHNPGVLDFQDAVRGPLSYDLVSLLRDVYIDWPRDRVMGWVEHYQSAAVSRGILPEQDSARFMRWFDLMGAQRHLKISGLFARLSHRDGKPGYLKDIPRALKYLLCVCRQYEELSELASLLEELGVYA